MRRALVATVLAAGLCASACDGRHRGSSSPSAAHDEPRAGPAIAILDLSDGVPEQPSTGLLGLSSKNPSFDELVREVERLGHDKSLRGILVRLGTTRIGL